MGGGSILGTEWQAASLVQNTLDRRDSEDVFFFCMPVCLVGVWVGLVALPVDMIC